MDSPRGPRNSGGVRKVSFADVEVPPAKRNSIDHRCRNPACEELRDIVTELRADNKRWQAEVLRLKELLAALGHPDRASPSHSPRGSAVSSPTPERRKSQAKEAAPLAHSKAESAAPEPAAARGSEGPSTSSSAASSSQSLCTPNTPHADAAPQQEGRRASCTGVDGELPPPEELFEHADPRFRSASEVGESPVADIVVEGEERGKEGATGASDGAEAESVEDHAVKEIRTFMSFFVGAIFEPSHSLSEDDKARFGTLCEGDAGRLWFARTLDRHRAKTMHVSDMTFFRLMQFISVALNECTLAEDFGPAKILMNMCFTFFRVHDGGEREYLASQLSNQPIFQNLRFWQAALFNSVAHERSRRRAMSGGNKWSQMTQTQREESITSDSNLVFGQMGTFIANMLTLGVPRVACEHFLDKMAVIGELNDEQKGALLETIERLSPRTLRVVLERDRLIGFGVSLRPVDGTVRVAGVLPLSPAARCGRIRTGDTVVSINGQSCESMSQQTLVRIMKGLGHTVTLDLLDAPAGVR